MTADRDAEHVIAQANQELDENGNFVKKQALARVGEEEAVDVPVSSVDYMDVSPASDGFRRRLPDSVPGAR